MPHHLIKTSTSDRDIVMSYRSGNSGNNRSESILLIVCTILASFYLGFIPMTHAAERSGEIPKLLGESYLWK